MAVATEAGLSMPYVGNLEKGRGNPTLDVVVALARALRVDPAELVASDEDEPRSTIDDLFASLPPVLVDYAQGRVMVEPTERMAGRLGLAPDAMRMLLVRAMAAAPQPIGRPLSKVDCRRLLDAYELILADPGDR
jgi:DNA-binding XRE family transcriptional regulator